MTANVGSAYGTFDLDLRPFRESVAEIRQTARQLRQEFVGLTAPAGTGRTGGGGRSTAAASDAAQLRQLQREARDTARQADQLEQRLRRTADAQIAAARAAGDYSRALDLVERELATSSNDLVRYNQLLVRQTQLQQQAARARPTTPAPTPAPSGGGVIGAVGAVAAGGAIVAGAVGFAQGTADAARYGQQLLQVEKRFNELAKAGGSTGDQLLQALRGVSGNQISDANLRLTATRAAIQGVGNSASELAPLLALATNRAKDLGLDTTQAFNDLVEGIAKAEPEILDNLGITLNLTQVYAEYSKQLGKTANDLTVAEKRTALLNAVLKQAGEIPPIDPDPYQRVATALTNIGDKGSQATANFFRPFAEQLAGALEGGLAGTAEGLTKVSELIQLFRGRTVPATQAEKDFITAILEHAGFQREANQQIAAGTQATTQQTQATQSAADAQRAQNVTLAEAIALSQQKAIEDQAQAEIQKVLDEAVIRVALGQSTQAAEVARLSALYPELAAQADPLIAQQLRLAAASEEVARKLQEQRRAEGDARLDAQRAQTRDQSGAIGFDSPGRQGTGDVDAVVAEIQRQKDAQQQAQEDLARARQRQLEQEETTAQRVARLRRVEAELASRGQQETAEFVNAQTERKAAERQLAEERERAATKGAKAGATAERAIASSLNTIENRTEDHYRKLRELQDDYQKDARRSQEDFERGRSRDQEDFQRERQKLLAEGNIAEARQLEEEFKREQAREQEDFNVRQARAQEDQSERVRKEEEDFAKDTGRTREKAAIRGVNLPGGASPQRAAAEAALSGPAAASAAAPGQPSVQQVGGAGATFQFTITPSGVYLNGEQIGQVTWPYFEMRMENGLAQVRQMSPAQTPATIGVGGIRR